MNSIETLRPLHDRVLIKRLEPETRSGLIYIPDTAQEKPQMGEVVAVGDYVDEVVPGHIVLFGKYAGHDIEGEFVIMGQDDVLCVLEKE